jgi:hypothetical protein
MKRVIILSVLLFVTACTYQVQVITPEPSLAPEVTAAQPTALPSIETVTPIPLPSPTAIIVPPAFTSTALPQATGIHPINFRPNGTYVDIADTILAGTSKTYSIEASKGQIMSISVNQSLAGDWVYIPMQITGADGTTLCPPVENTECTFWRGVLPATQSYFVKLMPVNDVVNFTMRVAVNPPGAATQSFQFNSAEQNAVFSYTDDFAPARFPGQQVSKVKPEIALELVDSQFYTKTNLIEAYFLFGSTNDSSVVANCTQPASFGGTENINGDVNINGIKFVRSEGGGVGAGNIYEQIYHRAASNDYCYEVAFYFHYGNIGNYDPALGVKEFNRDALLQKFEAILATLVIR